jgi:hypothetical protein
VAAADPGRPRAPRLRRGTGARLLAALLVLVASPAAAQRGLALTVLPRQGLQFGTLTAGTPTVVSPLDASRRATLELVGSGSVTVTFGLPAAMTAGSQTLPLLFGPGDGRITFFKSGKVIEFDPGAPFTFHIPPGLGGAYLHLGGSARPGAMQPPGAYTATITVNVVVASSTT